MPADYNIPMTDAQITEALQLMVERVSEGWAQGTYDGSPVGSGSPFYNKHSKYWAMQAADAAARAEAAVPAGTAGAVFFDRAQTLTTAQQEQARRNIKAGGSNRNLLDNPWFTVNQRGQSSYLSGRYTVDRWYGYQLTTDVNNDGSITITPISAGTGPVIQQRNNLAWAWGKTVVVSILNGDDTIDTWKTYVPSYATLILSGIMSSGMRIGIQTVAGGDVNLVIYPYDGNAHTIKAVKLELGSVCTIANDAPPNYAEELAKCQRYFVRLKSTLATAANLVGDFALSATAIDFIIALPQSLAKIPTITQAGVQAVTVTGTVVPITSISAMDIIANNVRLRAYGTFTQNTYYKLTISQNSYIDISADF